MIIGMTILTTIKVPTTLRDEITAEARSQQKTTASFLSSLMEEYRRSQRFQALRQALLAHPMDDEYWDEFSDFESLSGDIRE